MLPKGLASTPFGNSEGDLGLISGRQSEIVLPLAANSPTNRSFETISLALCLAITNAFLNKVA
jgi:hypothetical protein